MSVGKKIAIILSFVAIVVVGKKPKYTSLSNPDHNMYLFLIFVVYLKGPVS